MNRPSVPRVRVRGARQGTPQPMGSHAWESTWREQHQAAPQGHRPEEWETCAHWDAGDGGATGLALGHTVVRRSSKLADGVLSPSAETRGLREPWKTHGEVACVGNRTPFSNGGLFKGCPGKGGGSRTPSPSVGGLDGKGWPEERGSCTSSPCGGCSRPTGDRASRRCLNVGGVRRSGNGGASSYSVRFRSHPRRKPRSPRWFILLTEKSLQAPQRNREPHVSSITSCRCLAGSRGRSVVCLSCLAVYLERVHIGRAGVAGCQHATGAVVGHAERPLAFVLPQGSGKATAGHRSHRERPPCRVAL